MKITLCVLVLLAAFLAESVTGRRHCNVNKLRPHKDFNVTAFLGHWHVVSDYNVQGKAFSKFVDPMDMQAEFRRNKDGSLSFNTGAHLTLKILGYEVTNQCFGGSGRLEIPDPMQTSHWKMAFDTWFPYSPASYARSYYILSTDHKNYALLYTCYKKDHHGRCDPDYSFAWTLNRNRKGHTFKQWRHIQRAANHACLDHTRFRDRTGPKKCSLRKGHYA